MSNERLTAEAVLHAELLGHLQYRLREKVLMAMKQYAAQEAEHKTKHFIEQRDRALDERDNARIWIKSLQKERNESQQQAKQLQEERQNIVESLFSIRDMVHGTPWAVVNKLIDQLKQKNEEEYK